VLLFKLALTRALTPIWCMVHSSSSINHQSSRSVHSPQSDCLVNMSHRVTRSTQKQSARTQASRTTVEASSKKRKASSRPVAKKSAQPIRPPQPTPEEEEEGNEPQEADESSPYAPMFVKYLISIQETQESRTPFPIG